MTYFDSRPTDEPTIERTRAAASADAEGLPPEGMRTSRRSLLGALGAGAIAATTAGALAVGGVAGDEGDDPIYVRCPHPAVPISHLPAVVQQELAVALEEGVYESADRPRIVEVIDVEETYLRDSGTYYVATVERVEGGSFELALVEPDEPTTESPTNLTVINREDGSHTLSILVEDDEGVLFDETIEVEPNAGAELVWSHDVIGTYDVTVELADGQIEERGMDVSPWGGELVVQFDADGEFVVDQAVPMPPPPCSFVAEFDENRYERCDRLAITYDEFPAPVRAELDAALETDGIQHFADPPLLLQTMDVHESYVVVNGTYYSATVTRNGRGYVLELEEPEEVTVRRPRRLTLRNRSDETRTFAVRLGEDGETLREETVEVPPGETTSLFGVYVVGTYDLTVETDNGQAAEWDWNVGGSGSDASASLHPDGTLHLSQAVAGLARCPFDAGTEIELNGYEPQPHGEGDLYRDVDGSGTLGSNDVVVFFDHLEDDAVQDHPEYFDFNGSGGVGFDDVVALFEQV